MAALQNIRRVLVANRGEIAVRILRACRQLDLETVLVVSAADRGSVAAGLADQVVEIGPAEAIRSYLDIDRILSAARESGADAIHPGYGFLAENAEFARRVAAEGLVFVGPSARVIEEMGIKTTARARMEAAGVPVVPGSELPAAAGEDALLEAAGAVGYPLLVKAAAGGGGKGMRAVNDPADLLAAIEAARREAATAFADDTVYLERMLVAPRHVEVQILADNHGNVVHLGERDCSIQRRHQKVVEEAPAPDLPEETRVRMHAAAVTAAKSVGYSGAGTVEMLLDASGEFFFLEMNTRLQVEHPVTELVWGIDLVEQQLRVADGQELAVDQDSLRPRGHAIEVRLYAEDPDSGFLPQTGRVAVLEFPTGPGLRVDSGIRPGSEVSLHYDPMLAKLCACGENREQARRRLVELLRETALLGVNTNQAYLIRILEHPAFAAGEVHTGFVSDHLPAVAGAPCELATPLLAAAAALLSGRAGKSGPAGSSAAEAGPEPVWTALGAWRVGHEGVSEMELHLKHAGQMQVLKVTGSPGGFAIVREGAEDLPVELLETDAQTLLLVVEGVRHRVHYWRDRAELCLQLRGEVVRVRLEDPDEEDAGGGADLSPVLRAPMPGRILEVLTAVGDEVRAGQALVRMEAMKMEIDVPAAFDGVVRKIHVAEGALVDPDAELILLEAASFEPDEG